MKLISWAAAISLGLLAVAPPIGYSIPLRINSYHWLYGVTVAGLLGMLLLTSSHLPWSLKALSAYLFVGCFFSQAPALSFTAYFLVVFALWLFVFGQHIDFEPVLRVIQAVFWFQIILSCLQLLGKDTLVNFDRPIPVFVGTVMQYMRFGTMLACMAPFLLVSCRGYAFPLLFVMVLTQSSTLALSLIAGTLTWGLSKYGLRVWGLRIIQASAIVFLAYVAWDWGSFEGAIVPSNGGRITSWWAALQTWVLDTAAMPHPSPHLVGPWRWDWFFFGHGMDTFLPLFKIYKHDVNPFPQAHNDWLQLLWETGLVGFGLIVAYAGSLVKRLWAQERYGLIGGCAVVATTMFFAFPMRMTQTMFLLLAWVCLCERAIQCGRLERNLSLQ